MVIQSLNFLSPVLIQRRSALDWLRRNPFLLLCFACMVMILAPLMSGQDFGLENSLLEETLNGSQDLRNVVLACLALTIPLWLDQLLDLVSHWLATSYRFDWVEWLGRLSLQLVLIIPMIVIFAAPGSDGLFRHQGFLFISLVSFQIVVWAAVTLSLLNYYAPDTWTVPRISFLQVSLSLSYLLDLANLWVDSIIILVVVTALRFSCLVFFSSLFVQFGHVYTPSSLCLLPHKEYSAFVHGLTGSLAFLCYSVQPFFIPHMSVAYSTENNFIYYFALLSAFITLTTVLPGRSARFEALQLQQNLETKRTFVRYVSHEVRTPLNTICMGLELVEDELRRQGAKPDTIDTVGQLKEASLVAVETLSDLLLYEKIEAGIMALERTHVLPNPFLVKACQSFEVQARAKGVELAVHTTPPSSTSPLLHLTLNVDEKKMSQVIRNFISNAIKFTPAGGRVDVSLELKTVCNRSIDSDSMSPFLVHISVTDTGHGIAPENQHKVFNQIVQFHANKQQGGGGSGIGLWISKKIVELHGGKVGLFSEGEGKGCTFYLELPLFEVPAPTLDTGEVSPERRSPITIHSPFSQSRQPQSKRPSLERRRRSSAAFTRLSICEDVALPVIDLDAEEGEGTLRGVDVLVVDDSSLNRKVMTKALMAAGHRCIEAEDGSEAVRLVDSGKLFDVILMDSQMPLMRGTVATRKIRDLGYTGFVVGVTGNAMPADTAEFLAHGADMVLVKPMSIAMFEHAMDELRGARDLKNVIARITKSRKVKS